MFRLLNFSHSKRCHQYLMVVFICVSLMNSDGEYPSYVSFLWCTFYSEVRLFFLTQLKIKLFMLLLLFWGPFAYHRYKSFMKYDLGIFWSGEMAECVKNCKPHKRENLSSHPQNPQKAGWRSTHGCNPCTCSHREMEGGDRRLHGQSHVRSILLLYKGHIVFLGYVNWPCGMIGLSSQSL